MTKRKWPIVFEGKLDQNLFERWLAHHIPEGILNKIAPKEPFHFEAEVIWNHDGEDGFIGFVYPTLLSKNNNDFRDLIGKRGKLIFVEGEAE